MVFVEYRGKSDKRYAFIYNRDDLRDCIAWLQRQLDWMEKHDKQHTSVLDLRDEEEER